MSIAEQNILSETGAFQIYSGDYGTQSFTVTGGSNILCAFIKLRLGRQTGVTSGSVRMGVYADDGSDNPTGAELTGVTVPYTDLTEGAWDYNFPWHTFTLPSMYTFTAGVKYVIKVTSTMNHYCRWRRSNSNNYVSGVGKWTAGGSNDWTFQVYKADTITDDITADATLAKGVIVDATLQAEVADSVTVDAALAAEIFSSITADACLKWPDDKTRHKLSISFNSLSTSTGTEIDESRSIARNSRIARVYLILQDTGSSGVTIVDVNVDGTTIFTDQNKRPTIYAGGDPLVYSLPDVRNISANSQITLDIDSRAPGSSGLSVIVELNVATTYTNTVRKINILDDGVQVNTEEGLGYLTDKLQFQIIFDEPMNTSVEPVIVCTPISMLNTISVPGGGTWSTTFEKYDTYTTPIIDVSSTNFDGVSEITVSDAQNVFNEIINTYHSQIELSNGLLVEFENTYIKTVNNNILINSDTIKRFKYSFDNATWSTWQDYAESTTIDVTSAVVGGSAAQGLKTGYIILEDVNGNTVNKTITCYYRTTLSAVSNFSIQAAGKEHYWVLRWELPTETYESKIDSFKVYIDDVLQTTIFNPYPSYFSGLALDVANIVTDKTTDTITYPMALGIVYDSEGNKISIAAANLTAAFPIDNDRYDIIGIDEDGNYKIISGVEGVEFRPAYPFETINGITGDVAMPSAPSLEIGFMPLYYCRVRAYDWISSTGVAGKDCKVDVRWIFDIRSVDRKALIYLKKDEDEHVIKVQAVTLSGLTSNYTYNFSSISYPDVKYDKLQAWSIKDGGGAELINGDFVQENDGTLTNNILYYKFVEEEE